MCPQNPEIWTKYVSLIAALYSDDDNKIVLFANSGDLTFSYASTH